MKRTIVTTEEIDADSGECGNCEHQGVLLGVSVCQKFGGKRLRLSPVLETHMRIDECLTAERVAGEVGEAIKQATNRATDLKMKGAGDMAKQLFKMTFGG